MRIRPNTRTVVANKIELSQNIEKLPHAVLGAIAVTLSGKVLKLEDVYMVEIKLDDPMKHIQDQDDGLVLHTELSGGKATAEHLHDPEWAIIHKDDKDWRMLDTRKMITKLKEFVKIQEKENNDVRQNT